MPTDYSCSRCREATPPATCVVSESSTRCARCVRLRKSCNVRKFSAEELIRVQRARESLETQLRDAGASVSSLVAEAKSLAESATTTTNKLNAAVAKVERLEKIRATLLAKEHTLVEQGMREPDAEDGITPPVPDFSDFPWESLLPEEPPVASSSGTAAVP